MRGVEDFGALPGLEHPPWTSRYVQGLIDVPFLNLTSRTRSDIIQDDRYAALIAALASLDNHVNGLIEEQHRAEEELVTAEALVTITDSLEAAISPAVVNAHGLPGYTFEQAAGELWRCRFDTARTIVVNSRHRDFVFAACNRALQLRYFVRLYVKELALKNFAGLSTDQLLERMIELSLYAEEKLRSG